MLTFIKLLFSLGQSKTVPDDFYEKELDELNTDHSTEQLSTLVSQMILRASELLYIEHPYPTTVFSTIEEIKKALSSINKQKDSSYYTKALSLSETELNSIENSSIDKEKLSYRHLLFHELCATGTLDLDRILEDRLDSFFFNFREYWENAISHLKRKNAVENRRKYLIELTNNLDLLLKQRGITKYSKLLSDYRQYNVSILNTLQ